MIVTRLKMKRDREEAPRSVYAEDGRASVLNARVFGCIYADGRREALFEFDARNFSPADPELGATLLEAYRSFGVDMEAIRRGAQEDLERQRLEEYQRTIKEAMRHWSETDDFGAYASGWFSARRHPPFERAAQDGIDRMLRRGAPERTAALDKCRKLKRLAESTTFLGERDNATRQKAGLMAKHGIEEREL